MLSRTLVARGVPPYALFLKTYLKKVPFKSFKGATHFIRMKPRAQTLAKMYRTLSPTLKSKLLADAKKAPSFKRNKASLMASARRRTIRRVRAAAGVKPKSNAANNVDSFVRYHYDEVKNRPLGSRVSALTKMLKQKGTEKAAPAKKKAAPAKKKAAPAKKAAKKK